jgi:AAA+ ATPase superfamily predicted ATPase
MKFYSREKELKKLREIENSSKVSSMMTVIVGCTNTSKIYKKLA